MSLDPTLLSLGLGLLVVVAAGLALYRARRELRALQGRLRAFRSVERELEALHVQLEEIGARHLPPSQRGETAQAQLAALGEALASRNQELHHLHKRLAANLHATSRARQRAQELQERVLELERLFGESSGSALRNQLVVLGRERDQLAQRLRELNRALGGREAAERLLQLSRENAALKASARSNRRLIRSLRSKLRALERELAELRGLSVDALVQQDVDPGAYASMTSLPVEELVVRVGGSVSSSLTEAGK